jgi:hypothetical protein
MSAPTELARRHRWRWWEALPWLLALGAFFAFRLILLSQRSS